MRNARAATTILLAFGAIVPGSAQRSPSPQPLAISIVEANVINVRDGSVLPNVTIIVRNGLIESVGRNDPSADGPVINLKGHYIVPGLIDAHAHVADLDAGVRAVESGTTTLRSSGVTESEITAVVQEAAREGIPVAAHAFGDEATAAAIRAGVRSIEHGSYVSDATLRLMREKQVFLVPTLRILTVTPDSAPASVRSRVSETLPRARASIQSAHKIGVKVVAGTDSRYAADTNRFVSHEIGELAALGLNPLQALQSATIVSAEMLHLETRIGAVEPRYEADLIAVAGNPLVDVNALANPLFIMTNGRIALNKVGPIP